MDLHFSTRPEPDRTIPRFHLRAERNNYKSEQEGREIFEDLEFVEIITPGHNRSTPIERVTPEHVERWPEQYAAFKKGREVAREGTPLEQWPAVTPAMVAMMKALNVYSVEDLAGLSDAAIQNIGLGGRELRQKATDFLEAAKTSAPIERERARAEAAEAEVQLLKGQMQELMTRLARLEKEGGRGAEANTQAAA